MITFSQLGKYGRLGNQLFQYAAVKSLGLRRNYEVKIPDFNSCVWHGQECLLKHFNIKADFLTNEDYKKIKYLIKEADHSKFYKSIFNIPDNSDLCGYFQNYQYFSSCEKQIREEFTLKSEFQQAASEYLENMKKQIGDKEIVSVHMRRGDNTDGTNKEYANFYGSGDTLSKNSEFGKYLYKSLKIFKNKDVAFLIFSGGGRKGDNHNKKDIEWCKDNFFGKNVYYCEGNKDIVDFEIMRQCDHNITCHMTSFGWWAAFLNDNPKKIVVAPKNYTIPDDGRVDQGFYPPDWRII